MWKLVNMCCHKLNMPADRVWDMTVRDIVLSIQEPSRGPEMATHALSQRVMCLEFDRRRELYQKLTPDQVAELEVWKSQLM